MGPGTRSSLRCSRTGSSTRPPRRAKQKSTSRFSEDTMGCSTKQEQESMNHKIEELQTTMVQKMEELQKEVDELKEKVNTLQTLLKTNQEGSKVKGRDGKLLKVAVYCNGEQVKSGPFASAKFEILVIKGDLCASDQGSWSAETFDKSVVEAREVGSILKDTYTLEFVNGEAVLDGLVFVDNSSWVRGKRWQLGVRLLESYGVRVQEAISAPIRVLDRHGKASEKPHPPLLGDGVECLEKVGKKRTLDLRKRKVCTIKDFLQLYNRNRARLLKILGIKSELDACWKTMIEHAKECDVGQNLYSYRKKNTVLFFNAIHEVVGAEFRDHYSSFDKLRDSKKTLVNKWKKGFLKKITFRNLTVDFEMVNEQPVPIEHSFSGIPTDEDAQQNDETSSRAQEREGCFVVHDSTASRLTAHGNIEGPVAESCHDVSFQRENIKGSNTSQNMPIYCMFPIPSPGYDVEFPCQGYMFPSPGYEVDFPWQGTMVSSGYEEDYPWQNTSYGTEQSEAQKSINEHTGAKDHKNMKNQLDFLMFDTNSDLAEFTLQTPERQQDIFRSRI